MPQQKTPTPDVRLGADARRYLRRLRTLSERLDQQAALVRNGGYDTSAEQRAGRLADDAFAIRWALRQICAESEFLNQFFGALEKAVGKKAAGSP